MRRLVLLGIVALSCAARAGGVSFREDSIVLPTYAPGGYDKTPIFYTGRVYQGAQGRVYPYPMQDVLHDEKRNETYKYLTLENDWLQMGLLPEHGGHLLNLTDRATGFETFYRQHVVKPALIGMLGAWISGGVEWNFPHHHRATTAMPIDWRAVANADGSKTIWIGETELRRRLKWTIGLSLLPDRAVLQAENIFMNRQPWIESMIYWANVSVHCGDDYQVVFPPSCHVGFDHHKSFWTSFPIGPKKVDHTWAPSQRSKYANDAEGTIDLSWWRNFTVESRSIFALDPDNAWIAGFDHGRNLGTAHVSNRHLTVGKKFFLWGNFPEAHVWDTVLTDKDGPYLELMVGCWSDNQPDYSWIAPYETRKVKQFWFPVKGIGGVKNVTIDGAVNVERRGAEELLVGFHSTRVLTNCTVRVARAAGTSAPTEGTVLLRSRGDRPTGAVGSAPRADRTLYEMTGVSIDPNTPWCRMVKIPADVADTNLVALIADANGKVFLSYTPVGPDPHDPLPPKVANPQPPEKYTSAELSYEVGLRLDQFHNGILDPVPYYLRALEIDPDYTRANLAMGVRLAKNGAFAEAKPYLEKAVARATQNHTRALDAAPEYYLALCCRGLAKTGGEGQTFSASFLKRAEELLWRCTWRAGYKKEAYVEIARIAALRGDWTEALARIGDALALGQDEAKLWTMKGIFLRKLNRMAEAGQCLDRAIKCDPLEYWGVVERAFCEAAARPESAPYQTDVAVENIAKSGRDGIPSPSVAALAAAERNRGLKAQQLLECVCDYWGIGAYDEVIALCDAALAKAAIEKPYATEGALPLKETLAACDSYKNPMFAYFAAAAVVRGRAGSPLPAAASRGRAASMRPPQTAEVYLVQAESMATDYCFPSRLEELEVLEWAAARLESAPYQMPQSAPVGGELRSPRFANTFYYLGEILWNPDRKAEAISAWREAAARDPRHALTLRCLGFALSHPGTYFTNTGVPTGIANREAYDFYRKSLEADPTNFRTLEECDKLAEKLKIPAAERLAVFQRYGKTAAKYDACMLRLAYLLNATGDYLAAHKILTTRRFHVWEGAEGMLVPFVEACVGLGKAAYEKGDYATAQRHFEESMTYPANLQAGRPGDAGAEPMSRYWVAQCRKAQGDVAGCRRELENGLKGWIKPGEMDYWRVRILRELGRADECAPLVAELRKAIADLEKPAPAVIDAYAKFGGENSPMERAAKARERADVLRRLLAEIER